MLFAAVAGTVPAAAAPSATQVQTRAQSLAQDAASYAAQYGVTLPDAERRLRAQEASVAATDALREEFASRLAGIAVEHSPDFRIVVLLTGAEPVPDRAIRAAGYPIPVQFRTGAPVSQAALVVALTSRRTALDAALPMARGLGVDPRTGRLVVVVSAANARRHGIGSIIAAAEAAAGVPARVLVAERDGVIDVAVGGGARVEGVSTVDGRRYACTSGFAVTDGVRTGLSTAAHCPDVLTYLDPDGAAVPMAFAGQWGVSYRDVQVNVGETAAEPLFYADRRAGALRRLGSWRNRASTRAGDFVCHYGESSGYSCAEVELTDYAPPGELCGGPCAPMWVTVKGPNCRAGDSGGPAFLGGTAFGIAQSGSTNGGTCSFYYYMSVGHLPPPRAPLPGGSPPPPPPPPPAGR